MDRITNKKSLDQLEKAAREMEKESQQESKTHLSETTRSAGEHWNSTTLHTKS